MRLNLLIMALTLLVCSACTEKPVVPKRAPRAVSYMTLLRVKPRTGQRLTGTVESWKREDIGFEVAGRVKRVIEPGIDIEGRAFDENGTQISEGTVLAELDDKRYRIALQQAETATEAARTELEDVIPEQMAEAEAGLELADKELERFTNLFAKQSASRQQLDQAESGQKQAKAKVAQVEAYRATKASLLNTALATVDQAKINIADCELRSPFRGQIARVHVIPGGYVLPGQPVVTVQMMDPMRIQVAVSPETDKLVEFNDRVRVYVPNSDSPLEGYVYLKDTYADPATRTFLITLLVRNQKVEVGLSDEFADRAVARARKLWTLLPEEVGKAGNIFVELKALHQDDQGYFVWKVDNLTLDQIYEEFDPVLKVSKVRVSPGLKRVPVLQVFTFRELSDAGGLNPDTDVIIGDIEGDISDGQVILSRERWLLRPGDLAEVALRGGAPSEGFYVPRVAILSDGDTQYVVTVPTGSMNAKRVNVHVSETSGELQRIESVETGGLREKDRIIVGGAHYVTDGEEVSLVEQLEAQP